MKFLNDNLLNGSKTTDCKNQTIEKEVKQYNQNQNRFEQLKIQIQFTSDHQIIYQTNGVILRVVQANDTHMYPETFNNIDQIKHLTLKGQFSKNKIKNGKWIAIWEGNILKNSLGYYKDGQKHGLWKDLFLNFQNQVQVFETGEYSNGFRIGYKDWRGFYNTVGQKTGKWIELDQGFVKLKEITYSGDYNVSGKKVGRWDTMKTRGFGYPFKQIGGGSYSYDGSENKIGRWIELDEGFYWNQQITYRGEYNQNSRKVGRWDTWYNYEKNTLIGGGSYDQVGSQKKFGQWVELDNGFSNNKQVTQNGEYNTNGNKIGRWDIKSRRQNGSFKQIGGGSYDQQGSEKKIEKWVELDENFNYYKQATYIGDYNLSGKKVGRWDIMCFSQFTKEKLENK